MITTQTFANSPIHLTWPINIEQNQLVARADFWSDPTNFETPTGIL